MNNQNIAINWTIIVLALLLVYMAIWQPDALYRIGMFVVNLRGLIPGVNLGGVG